MLVDQDDDLPVAWQRGRALIIDHHGAGNALNPPHREAHHRTAAIGRRDNPFGSPDVVIKRDVLVIDSNAIAVIVQQAGNQKIPLAVGGSHHLVAHGAVDTGHARHPDKGVAVLHRPGQIGAAADEDQASGCGQRGVAPVGRAVSQVLVVSFDSAVCALILCRTFVQSVLALRHHNSISETWAERQRLLNRRNPFCRRKA